jgi:hypothetical protein
MEHVARTQSGPAKSRPASERSSRSTTEAGGDHDSPQGVLSHGPQVQALAQLQRSINQSPRAQSIAQLQRSLNQSSCVTQLAEISARLQKPSRSVATAQRQGPKDDAPLQRNVETAQREAEPVARPNRTGLPDNLKSGIESLSGVSLDGVKVHYGSEKPAQLNALAYAQGTDIHVAPGQEKHLPHEAWHIVQQAQGRVTPTMQLQGGLQVNDNEGLEHEADIMGSRASASAVQMRADSPILRHKTVMAQQVIQAKVKSGVLNVAGETHKDYEVDPTLRGKEKKMATDLAGGTYWTESEFKVTEDDWWYEAKKGQSGDPVLLQFLQALELVDSIGGRHFSGLDHTIPDQAKLLRTLAENCIRILAGGVVDRYSELKQEFQAGMVTLNEAQSDAAEKLGPKIADMNSACGALYNDINVDGSLKAPGNTATLRANCARYNAEIKQLGAVLHKKTMTEKNIRVPRSTQMHNSAQASFATPGIWKIGNNHYADIIEHVKGAFVKAPKYNLLSKDEFNNERNKIP